MTKLMNFGMKKIAIIGATSHIAKGLIYNFLKVNQYQLILFARSSEKVMNFLKEIKQKNEVVIKLISEFGLENYDIIINCIGIGNPSKLEAENDIFRLTEHFDNLVIDYIYKHQDSMYINFSSGAVYGSAFDSPVNEFSSTCINVNHILTEQHYCIAKLNSEAKHRSMQALNIIDLRIFGYFSHFIDLDTKYLLSEIILCIKSKKEFFTGATNIVRDYVHPLDLFSLIQQLITKSCCNDAFDVLSLHPVSKFEILDYFRTSYDLKYRIIENPVSVTATGNKNNYFSTNKKVFQTGYSPAFTSLEAIIKESKEILK
jgi:nucleoside-diphosphate-sugar epimerase